MRSSKTGHKTSSVALGVACSAVLLKSNVANILFFNFCEQKFVQYGPVTIAIDCNGLSLLIFEEKRVHLCLWSKIRTNLWLVLGASAFQYMRAGFLWNATILLVYIPAKIKMSFIWNDDFFLTKSASSVSRSQAHLAKRINNHIRSAEG